MSVRKRKDQDMSKCVNILSAEVIEHEDQDPPYPACSKTAQPVDKTRGLDPDITTIKTLDTKKKLLGREPRVSFPNFEGESSMTENVNIHRFSKSLSLTSHIENLQQSMVLKSILSKKLQDLSDELFSKPEVHVDIETRRKSHSFPLLSVHGKPTDLNWLSEKDTLSPKALLSEIIKNIPSDSLSERGPGKSTEVEREHVSEKHLEAGERIFPLKRKSSFKKKHLQSEVSNSKLGLNGSIHDYFIKQIFTAPSFSEIGVQEPTETQLTLWDQLPTAWQGSLPLHNLRHHEEDDETELLQPKSIISQIIQAFPVDTLIESGLIKVVEIDKEYQKSSLLNSETDFPEEKPNYSRKDNSETKGKTEHFSEQNIPTVLKETPFAFNQVNNLDKEHQESSLLNSDIVFPKEKPNYSTYEYSETKSKTEPFSKQNIPIIPKETTYNRVKFIDGVPNTSPQDSKYQSTPDRKTDLPRSGQRLYREENDLNSILQNLSNSLVGKLNESDEIMLKSFFRNIFNAFFKYNQSETRQPERELENLNQHSFPNNTEDLEDIRENFDKADKLDSKTILSPKLRLFLEKLSESEIKNLKSELSKHIQHYLVERLSESGHISQEDLPKIYQNLYLMNEKAEPKGQNIFLEKYSETVKEIMSFVKNFNHHFIDKHLEIKLRSFLNEILQNYFLENLSESRLFEETESETILSNVSSLSTKSASISLHDLGQDISRESFGRRLEINMNHPLNKSLQHYLIALSENELSNLTADLGRQLLNLFIEQLVKSGLITERQLEGINQYINLINSSSTPLKCIKTDLSFKDENQFMEEHSEKQNKYSKIVPKKVPEDRCLETELMRKEENEYFSLHNSKENSSIFREQKIYYSKEEAKTLSLIKVQPSSNINTQAIPLNTSSESFSNIVFKNQKKEHGFIELPRAENSIFKAEIQDPYSWGGKAKITQSKACFERTLKMKPIEKKERINIYKLSVQEKPETMLSPYPRIPNCKLPNEDEEYLNRLTFPSWQNNTLTHFNSETGEKSKLEDQYCQRLKGNNNNNKKHLVTFAQHKKEIQTLHIKPNGICSEKRVKTPESQSFKYNVEGEKNSKTSLFPEVLKRESLKSKVRKERDHVGKQNKSFSKIVRILPTTLPNTRIHLRKSVPKTLLHWTARRTVHDCSDKFEDLHGTSFKHLEKAKSRTRLLGKSPDDSQNQSKFSTRPYTAPELNKRQQSYTGKFTSPRMVSAGLVHINDSVPSYEMHKIQQKRLLKENDEKCSLICDIIQMLNRSE